VAFAVLMFVFTMLDIYIMKGSAASLGALQCIPKRIEEAFV